MSNRLFFLVEGLCLVPLAGFSVCHWVDPGGSQAVAWAAAVSSLIPIAAIIYGISVVRGRHER